MSCLVKANFGAFQPQNPHGFTPTKERLKGHSNSPPPLPLSTLTPKFNSPPPGRSIDRSIAYQGETNPTRPWSLHARAVRPTTALFPLPPASAPQLFARLIFFIVTFTSRFTPLARHGPAPPLPVLGVRRSACASASAPPPRSFPPSFLLSFHNSFLFLAGWTQRAFSPRVTRTRRDPRWETPFPS